MNLRGLTLGVVIGAASYSGCSSTSSNLGGGGAGGASSGEAGNGDDAGAPGGSGAAAGGTAGGGSASGASGAGSPNAGEPGAGEPDGGESGSSGGNASCTPNPCFNGGVCELSGASYRCECAGGHSGTHCEIPCDLTDTLILFESFAPAQRDKLETSGVEIFGPADLVFTPESGAAAGLGVAGGLADYLVDGVEYVTFRFTTPAHNVSYYVQGSTPGSNQAFGESSIEAFDASGVSLGKRTVVDLGQKNVSVLFDDEPISKFTITLLDDDAVNLGNVRYASCMSP